FSIFLAQAQVHVGPGPNGQEKKENIDLEVKRHEIKELIEEKIIPNFKKNYKRYYKTEIEINNIFELYQLLLLKDEKSDLFPKRECESCWKKLLDKELALNFGEAF